MPTGLRSTRPGRRRATLDGLRRLLLRESQEQPLLLVFEDSALDRRRDPGAARQPGRGTANGPHPAAGELPSGVHPFLGQQELLHPAPARSAGQGRRRRAANRAAGHQPDDPAATSAARQPDRRATRSSSKRASATWSRPACWQVSAAHISLLDRSRRRGCRRRSRWCSPPASTGSTPTEKRLLQTAAVIGKDVPFRAAPGRRRDTRGRAACRPLASASGRAALSGQSVPRAGADVQARPDPRGRVWWPAPGAPQGRPRPDRNSDRAPLPGPARGARRAARPPRVAGRVVGARRGVLPTGRRASDDRLDVPGGVGLVRACDHGVPTSSRDPRHAGAGLPAAQRDPIGCSMLSASSDRLVTYLQQAEDLTVRLGDRREQALTLAATAIYRWWVGEHHESIATVERALLVYPSDDDMLRMRMGLALGQSHIGIGDYRRALRFLGADDLSPVAIIAGVPDDRRLRAVSEVRAWLARCLAEVGDLREATCRRRRGDPPGGRSSVPIGPGHRVLGAGALSDSTRESPRRDSHARTCPGIVSGGRPAGLLAVGWLATRLRVRPGRPLG